MEYKKETVMIRVKNGLGEPEVMDVDAYDFGESGVVVAKFAEKWFIFDRRTGKPVGDSQTTREGAVMQFKTVWFPQYMNIRGTNYYRRQTREFDTMKKQKYQDLVEVTDS